MALVHTWAARDRVRAAAARAKLVVVSSVPVVLRDGREPHLGLYELAHVDSRAIETAPREPLVIRDAKGARTRLVLRRAPVNRLPAVVALTPQRSNQVTSNAHAASPFARHAG